MQGGGKGASAKRAKGAKRPVRVRGAGKAGGGKGKAGAGKGKAGGGKGKAAAKGKGKACLGLMNAVLRFMFCVWICTCNVVN